MVGEVEGEAAGGVELGQVSLLRDGGMGERRGQWAGETYLADGGGEGASQG